MQGRPILALSPRFALDHANAALAIFWHWLKQNRFLLCSEASHRACALCKRTHCRDKFSMVVAVQVKMPPKFVSDGFLSWTGGWENGGNCECVHFKVCTSSMRSAP